MILRRERRAYKQSKKNRSAQQLESPPDAQEHIRRFLGARYRFRYIQAGKSDIESNAEIGKKGPEIWNRPGGVLKISLSITHKPAAPRIKKRNDSGR